MGDACPLTLLPPPLFWRPERSLVMEGVSAACGLPFQPGRDGEEKSTRNLEKLSELL